MNRIVVVLAVAVLVIKNVSAECFGENGADVSQQVCIPGHWNIARFSSAAITATSTCGNPPANACPLKPSNNGCKKCNSSDPALSHPAKYILDKPRGAVTYWQSDTWWVWHQTYPNKPLQVNVTLTFNKSFDATGLLTLTFLSPRPFEMVLEKSNDFGATWKALQYYANDCQRRFKMQNTEPMDYRYNDLNAYCTEEYSKSVPGELLFDFKTRYEEESGFFMPNIQKYLHVTNLRFRLEYPGTDGMENSDKTEDILSRFFYAISDLSIIGRCRCNGHASYCIYNGANRCSNCTHFTTGVDCEKCLPLYNNRPWRPATSKFQPNPCEKCECNEHADSCEYNNNLSHGVCDDCKHNTTGYYCEKCQDKFYRNVSIPLNHSEVCLACDCFQQGILNNGSCHNTTGQCECRQNVTGRQCDHCVDTYYGYSVQPVGHCKACECVQFGTKNGSLNCHQTKGQCDCKENINQKTCSKCKDGFYKFPVKIIEDCLKCDCDYGGSSSGICNKVNGNCECRKNIQGTRCTVVLPGYFTGSFTYFKTEAEQSSGNYLYTSNTNDLNKYFTGTGYAKITPGQHINFKFTSDTFNAGFMLLRYTDTSQGNIGLQVKVTASGTGLCSGMTKTFPITDLQKGQGQAWLSKEAISMKCKGQPFSFNVSYTNSAPSNASIEIDSLIIYPEIKDTRIYKIAEVEGVAHGFNINTIVSCWNNWTTLISASESQPICKNISFSAMAQVLDGALPCGCNSTGSVSNTTCDHNGGQCQCKPGVTGRSCDRCMPGHYNLTSNGCSACNCSSIGSNHLVCNAITGQCPCKPGVISRTCDQCNHTYYGFNTGKGCVECKCNASGSVDLQCDGVTGVCPCKNSTAGTKCDQCKHGYYNYTSQGCQSCQCDTDGSTTQQCDLQTGKCMCKANVQGFKCNECKQGFYNRDVHNPTGCTQCYCYTRSSTCSSATGYVKSTIESNPMTSTWQPDSGGFDRSDKSTGIFSIKYTANKTGTLLMPSNFSGVLLKSYSQLFSFKLSFKTPESANLSLSVEISARSLKLEFPLSPKPSVNVTTYSVLLHENNSIKPITASKLQESLANVFQIKLKATFMSSGSMEITSAKLGTAVKGNNGEFAGNVENCTCVDSNYTGFSCQLCSQGYTRWPINKKLTNLPRYSTRCELCSCTNRSKECHRETGKCDNCRTGSTGYFCEECQNGVDNSTILDCKQCFPGYYGLYLNKFEGCGRCNCILPNTLYGNQSVCRFDDGQCECKANISGRVCDRCHENAYNDTKLQGQCVDCPICYRLLQIFVHKLRKDIITLEGSLTSLRNGGSGDLTFEKRLIAAGQNVRLLVQKASNSTGIEKDLHDELQNLNQTLDKMEALLRDNVTSGVTSLEGEVTVVSRNRNRTAELIELTETMISDSYRLLNSSIRLLVDQADASDRFLSRVIPIFEAYKTDALSLADTQNITGQDIINKTNTAGEMVRDSKSTSLQTEVDHKKNTEVIRKLLSDSKMVKNLSIQTNNTAYLLVTDSTIVLKNAQQALESDMALNTTNKAELQVILSTMNSLTVNATAAIKAIENFNNEYKSLRQTIETSVREAAVLMAQVATVSQDATGMLNEARRAETEAKIAVTSAAKTHKDAKEMLQILQEFKTKANASQQLAATALEKSKEANQTSREAIAYSKNINASIQATLKIAMQGVNTATTARDLANKEYQDVSKVYSQAMILQNNVESTKHTPENFRKISKNVTNINTQIEQPINACQENYTRYAKDAREKSTKALNDATNANTGINNAKKSIDNINIEFGKLQQVNATRLRELQNEIKRLRSSFEQRDVSNLNKNLQDAMVKQKTFIDSHKQQVKELRRQVNEMKQLRNSLKAVPHRGCT